MAATVSATGTWTVPSGVDLVAAAKTQANVPTIEDMNFENLKTTTGVVYPELQAFIQLFADGLGIGFWPASALLFHLMKSHMMTWTPDVGSRVFPSA